MLSINNEICIPDDEIELSAIRSSGAGGQNVNKVSSAIHLRFDIHASSLPYAIKQRILQSSERRISKAGVIIIKAQEYRDQEKNRAAALERLKEIIVRSMHKKKPRVATRPSKRSQQKRLDQKTRHGRTKALRRNIGLDN